MHERAQEGCGSWRAVEAGSGGWRGEESWVPGTQADPAGRCSRTSTRGMHHSLRFTCGPKAIAEASLQSSGRARAMSDPSGPVCAADQASPQTRAFLTPLR